MSSVMIPATREIATASNHGLAGNNPSPLERYRLNPLLTPKQMPFECSCVFNAGAIDFEGQVLLLLRSEDYSRQTRFHVATSRDGIHFDVRPEPIR